MREPWKGSKQQRTTVLSATNDTLLCPTPPFASPVDVHLLLSRDNLVYIDTGLDYTYYVQPSLFTDVQPEGEPSEPCEPLVAAASP